MSDDRHRFTPASFLRDRLGIIATALVVLAFIALALYVMDTSADGIMLIESVALLAIVLVLLFEYWRQRSFWRTLEDIVEALDKMGHYPDLAEEPSFLEGELAHEAICTITERATQEVADVKAENTEHATYTELWVHEVKTPLAAARLLLNGMHGPEAAKLRFEFERIEGLVEQSLFAARSGSLANDYLLREVTLAEVVNEACKSNMQCLTSRGIDIDNQIDPEIKVIADKSWLAFMIGQIISNAAKYGASTISFRVMPPPDEGPHACTIFEIADDGCGIPAADVPRVFDRGFTGEVGRAHGSATGMGLYLVARMCGQLGLGIMLASEEGVGTRVDISFPHDRRKVHALQAG